MSIAQFIAQLIWFGLFFASIGVAVDVTKALRDKAVEAHSKGPISAGKFTRMMVLIGKYVRNKSFCRLDDVSPQNIISGEATQKIFQDFYFKDGELTADRTMEKDLSIETDLNARQSCRADLPIRRISEYQTKRTPQRYRGYLKITSAKYACGY